MRYSVISGWYDNQGNKAPVGIADDFMTTEEALLCARTFIEHGELNVAITDDAGNSISGDALCACCRGDKQLTPDLRAV